MRSAIIMRDVEETQAWVEDTKRRADRGEATEFMVKIAVSALEKVIEDYHADADRRAYNVAGHKEAEETRLRHISPGYVYAARARKFPDLIKKGWTARAR